MSTVIGNIRITVNGDAREYSPGRSVVELLADLGLNPYLVVVERNREILDRRILGTTTVQADDVFELVHFVGGG